MVNVSKGTDWTRTAPSSVDGYYWYRHLPDALERAELLVYEPCSTTGGLQRAGTRTRACDMPGEWGGPADTHTAAKVNRGRRRMSG